MNQFALSAINRDIWYTIANFARIQKTALKATNDDESDASFPTSSSESDNI